jgi:hypothetical protein
LRGHLLITSSLLPYPLVVLIGENYEARFFDLGCSGDQLRGIEPNGSQLSDHSLAERILSDLEQLDSRQAASKRLQDWTKDLQNI